MNQREPDSVKVAEELFAQEELIGGTIPAGNAPAETDAGREAVRRELLELDQALKLAVPALPDQEKEQALVERVMAAAAGEFRWLSTRSITGSSHSRMETWLCNFNAIPSVSKPGPRLEVLAGIRTVTDGFLMLAI